ncbi:hypothetical protein L202_04618 [Cryptococcus amylolentus CBS 6039]|uniref:Uncharacterized protein n=1 Tax=Cryptococcus amylolentus CBS 6039 TaxID=1295533 RepID=A0A1E3HM78_9TREE|nr:hypothetical protein L202_04618 [Cryptococcus amylolentus CBS 6039]ODN77440.1 hypothetical protein L202_04618 [Cryptococcus amylolentus CBS 6039]
MYPFKKTVEAVIVVPLQPTLSGQPISTTLSLLPSAIEDFLDFRQTTVVLANPRTDGESSSAEFPEGLADAIARILEDHAVTLIRRPLRGPDIPPINVQVNSWRKLRDQVMEKVRPSVMVEPYSNPPVSVTVDMDLIRGVPFGDVMKSFRRFLI